MFLLVSTGLPLRLFATTCCCACMQVRPWLMATACSDHQVRVYDRRRLSLRDPAASAASQSLLDLCPLHLHLPGHHPELVYTTCARFSNRGDRLVATYPSEHVRGPLLLCFFASLLLCFFASLLLCFFASFLLCFFALCFFASASASASSYPLCSEPPCLFFRYGLP